MAMYFAYDDEGNQYGPVGPDQLNKWVKEGRLGAHNFVTDEGSGEQMTLLDVPGVVFDFSEEEGEATQPDPAVPPFVGDMVHEELKGFTGQQRLESNLTKAIFSTVCCCLPLGVIAIVYAAQVDGHLRMGNRAEAAESARQANLWANTSIGVGFVLELLYLLGTGKIESFIPRGY